jgi:pilus assembly protein CpaB
MRIPRFLADRHLLALVAALALGAVAYFASREHLAAREQAAEARVAERHRRETVLVVRTDVPSGTVLTRDVLATRQVPARYLSTAAARVADLERVEGQRLLHDARAGDPVLWPALAGGERAAFSAALPAGRRALTFPVDDVNAFSGLLVPGDVIDLLYADPNGGRPTVRALLQRVTVLATGTTTRARTVTDDAGVAREETARFATITLGVSPVEAQAIVLAQRTGELTAVLRHPADGALVPAHTLDASALAGAVAPSAPRVNARREYVEVITGSGRARAERDRLVLDRAGEDAAPARRADAGDVRQRLAPEPAPESAPPRPTARRSGGDA